MNKVIKVLFRAYQEAFHAAIPLLPYREPLVLSSVRAIGGLLTSIKKKNALIVTGRTLYKIGALSVIEA
ncbi:MAG: hypothetical protein J6Q67_07265, partial [Clostridia bacterium]|nr:hypothetical protein [Clostridia bacterium]